MAEDLTRMCNAVHKHGLVDYQYGVSKERIIMSKSIPEQFLHANEGLFHPLVIEDCLDAQKSEEGQGIKPAI
jgi:hypothetical protein